MGNKVKRVFKRNQNSSKLRTHTPYSKLTIAN